MRAPKNTGNITPEESFTDAYSQEVHEPEQVCTSTEQIRLMLDAKYEYLYLNKVMRNQYQYLIETQRNELLKLLQKFEDFFDVTLGTWKMDQVDSELKESANPICSRPYTVPKIHAEMLKRELERLDALGVFKRSNE